MLDLLKKIGVPATVAAVIATLVTIVPLLFTVDERYAKAEDLEKMVAKLESQLERQNRELAQLAGFQQAMISLILQGRIPTTAAREAPPPPPPAAVVAPAPPPAAVVAPSAGTPPRPTAARRPSVPEKVSGTVPAPAAPIEKPKNWNEINDGLVRQQQRLIRD